MAIGIPNNQTKSATGGKRRALQKEGSHRHHTHTRQQMAQQEEESMRSSRSLKSTFPDSQVYSLLKPLAQALYASNGLMNERVLTVRIMYLSSTEESCTEGSCTEGDNLVLCNLKNKSQET